ncbi:hypothetical protein ON010_g9126 [Phytophthora cinnamomi]|nr:hypothetical protein ON010_g9126 [Phytophthora cinnamomi]
MRRAGGNMALAAAPMGYDKDYGRGPYWLGVRGTSSSFALFEAFSLLIPEVVDCPEHRLFGARGDREFPVVVWPRTTEKRRLIRLRFDWSGLQDSDGDLEVLLPHPIFEVIRAPELSSWTMLPSLIGTGSGSAT